MLALRFKSNKLQFNFNRVEKYKILGKFLENYISGKIDSRNFSYKLKSIKILSKYYFNQKSRVSLKRRCIYTNRSKSLSKKYGVSRFILRDFIQFGFLAGYKKAVW
jgi:ribosomal protein S14